VGVRDRNIRKRDLFAIALIIYLIALLTFTFFPRPILESGNPSAIAEYLQTHANFFYKILYADTHLVAIGNLFMLTPFVYLAKLVFPQVKLIKLFLFGVFISLAIEFSQLFIPGRVSDPLDFLANSASVLLGVFLVRLLLPKQPR
jgi:glycopeptide antibiotics resistance protein